MRKLIFTIAFAITTILTVSAQEIGSVLLPMPESIVFGLEAAQKNLLISDTKDTTQIVVDRGTYGDMKRLAISPDYIALQTSEAGTIQIKLLPLINDSKIVCLVKTVCGSNGVCDSQMQFYTTTWIPIPQTDLLPAKNKDWFIKPDVDRQSQDFINAYAALDMTPMKFTLSPNTTSLTAEYDIKDYLSEEDYKKIEPYLTGEPKVFTWDKSSYK
ncbi:DUF3256 family protein [Dysgonomonas sp. OttesenSCG-928-D17]|nr:DUF3256 family protein [Dysgonomonas sp. OttesenSCG-928-D17]